MKKTSKIFGSIALSAALAMGTAVPAFAAPTGSEADPTIDSSDVSTSDLNVGDDKTTDTSATIIKASTYTSQLSVTIPLAVPLKFDTVGGPGMAPSDNSYYIKNNSSSKITVTQAAYEVTDNEWRLASAAITGTPGTSPVAVGDFYLNVHPTATVQSGTLKDLELKAIGSNYTDGTADLNWGIQPSQQYGFALSPSSSKLNKTVEGYSEIASIVYTVAVGDNGGTGLFGEVVNNDDPDATVTTIGAATGKPAMTGKAIKASFGATVTCVNASGVSTTVGDTDKVKVEKVQIKAGSKWYDCDASDVIESGSDYQLTVTPVTD